MSMGKHEGEQQGDLWLATQDLAQSAGHPFYVRLNAVLRAADFDARVEELCRPFYSSDGRGRPSLAPGVYFRMLLIGYFEGIDSERGIAWRCADSLALRSFLGFRLDQATPDHSTLCRIRQRLSVEVHEQVFAMVLELLSQQGLLRGESVGIDATTLEANAALRSIVRRDDGASYDDFLKRLAAESGIESPTRAQLTKLDRKRPRKGSNAEWTHPGDPDAEIVKMKDGRTHLAHKSEHAVDLESGAVLAVTLHGGARGDTSTVLETMLAASKNAVELGREALPEWVCDKGYHSNATMEVMETVGMRSYVSEPDRGRRHWKSKETAQKGTYANRRRIRGERGKRQLLKRAELVERSFAHCLETGGMRRTWLRGRANILKRYLVHVAGFNLGIVMRKLVGVGTPRGLADLARRVAAVRECFDGLIRVLGHLVRELVATWAATAKVTSRTGWHGEGAVFSTGC
jgi:transposase